MNEFEAAGAARAARDAGMDLVEANSTEREKAAVKEAIRAVARRKQSFTTDDVLAFLPVPPSKPKVLGPLMVGAAKEEIIKPMMATGPDGKQYRAFEDSGRVASHGRGKQVWESKIYSPPAPPSPSEWRIAPTPV